MNQTIVLLLNFSCVAHLYVLIAIQQLSELLKVICTNWCNCNSVRKLDSLKIIVT